MGDAKVGCMQNHFTSVGSEMTDGDHLESGAPLPTMTDKNFRSTCQGDPRLPATVAPWMIDEIRQQDGRKVHDLVEQYGSPLHWINPVPFEKNVKNLQEIFKQFDLDSDIFFARKANKCLTFVESMQKLDGGVAVASIDELIQVLDFEMPSEKIICTAAVKSRELVQMCVQNDVTIVIDNRDELSLAAEISPSAKIAIRIGGFTHEGTKLQTRFGFDVDDVVSIIQKHCNLSVEGIQFDLEGCDWNQRVSAINQSLPIVDELREEGHPVQFLDIGGGFPVNYLENESDWDEFWTEHFSALQNRRPPITFQNHALGLGIYEGQIYGDANVYPFFQSPSQNEWLESILNSVSDDIKKRQLQLRCEPGRALLDGTGMTAARVEFVKERTGPCDDYFIGLSMNRTQCRSGSDDFLVDPILVKKSQISKPAKKSGYLVGAYCTESELLSLRKLHFPNGIERGDIVISPNTAGYFMHSMESRSHQFPLAKNYLYREDRLDDIDYLA